MAGHSPIRRSTRATGQTYSVDLDEEARSGKPVRIRQVFRTITPQWSHRLYFAVVAANTGLVITPGLHRHHHCRSPGQ